MQKYVFLLLLAGIFRPAAAQPAPVRPAAFAVRPRLVANWYSPAAPGRPAGPAAAPGVQVAIPTVRAAAAYAPLPASHGLPSPVDSLPPVPRRDLTGVAAAPPHDLYQNLPEEFRKRTLPAPWTEPLPLQLLRGALGR